MWPGQNDHHSRPGKSPNPQPGVVRPPGQGCHRASGSPVATRGVLLSLLSGCEERWRTPPHSRPEGSQQIPEGHEIPYDQHCRGAAHCRQGGMVYFNRPEGCLLSCPHSTTSQAVPAVCLSRASFPVQSAPVRPLSFPTGVHQMCYGSPLTPAVTGYEDPALPGRLACLCAIPVSGGPGHDTASLSCGQTRSQGKFCEELSGSLAEYPLPGYDSRCRHHDGPSITATGGRHSPPPPPLSGRQEITLRGIFAPPREIDRCRHRGSFGAAVTAPPSEVAEQLSVGCQVAPAQETQGVTPLPPSSGSMEEEVFSSSGLDHGFCRIQAGGHHDGCLPLRLGSCVAESDGSGAVACSGPFGAYQCVGAAGCAHGSAVFSSLPERPACPGTVRQRFNRVSHKPPGGHQVCSAVAGVPRPPVVGSATPGQPESNVFAWRQEPGGRLPLSSQASTGGVETPSRGDSEHLGHLWQGRGGSLCHRGIDPLPPVVLFDRGEQSSGSGCSRPRLAGQSPLRISANPSDFSDATEGPPAGSQTTVSSPFLAGEDVVPSTTQALPQLPMAPARQEGSPVSVTGPDLAPRPPAPATVGLATAGSNMPLTGCSDAVRNTILNARAPSTRAQYENRWQLFTKWCSDKGEDPVHCSVPRILDFLQSLLDSGRSPATLRVYVAAISSRHAQVDNGTVGSHRLVSSFLKGAWRLRPPRVLRVPPWDLRLVLDALCLPPFEPLAQAELRWVSVKTAFLLAVISAKRVGELHALSVSDSCLRWNSDGTGVTLWPNTAFLPKVLSSSNLNRPIHLAQFVFPEGDDNLTLLCPVRALRLYIAATAGIRQSDQLFLCYGGPRKGCALSKQRLSHWVVDVITHAYKRSGRPVPSGVRCHSTRAVSTSWAALRGVPLEDICGAASWASPNTFARFYRVNVASPHPLGVVLGLDSAVSSQ